MYSGPVAAHAYRQLRNRSIGLVVLVGPSHFLEFDGVSIYRAGGFDTPLGIADIDEECASAIMAAAPIVHERAAAHAREHSLEMQLPFLQRVAPAARIVPSWGGSGPPKPRRGPRRAECTPVASTDLHYHTLARQPASTASCRPRFVLRCGRPRALDADLSTPAGAVNGSRDACRLRRARLRFSGADSGDVPATSDCCGYLARSWEAAVPTPA